MVVSVTADGNIQHDGRDMVVRNTAVLSGSIALKFLLNETTKRMHSYLSVPNIWL